MAKPPEFFLPRRLGWMKRGLFGGMPVRPTMGDRGPVYEAIADIVDAAGALEHSRGQLARVIEAARIEFETLHSGPPPDVWAGANTPAVYHQFYNAVAWTRAVSDRYGDRLHPAVKHDPVLWVDLQKIRSTAATQFEEARLLAKVSLHKFTPPYTGAGAKVEAGVLVYPVPKIVDADDYRKNPLVPGRHAAFLVNDFWAAVEKFVDQLLDVFYP